jgi:SAM-dependent MidA family methyltransferase
MSGAARRETIEAFMARALTDPQEGYYTRHIAGVGCAQGDFSTAATLDGALGRAVAAWVRTRLRETGTRAVIEVGGGSGSLARAILGSFPFWRRTPYHLVEVSGPLRARQQEALRGRRAAWHGTMEEALAACGGRAVIVANELVDAFPCRQFEWRDGAWLEVALEWAGGAVRETMLPAGRLPDSELLALSARAGQRVEVQESYQRWLAGWAPAWKRGMMLAVDYGHVLPPAPRLPLSGTLRAYFRQMRLEGEEVYRRVGLQDLTADVCFNDVRRWGEALGWRTRSLERQGDWLRRWHADAHGTLADPQGAGGAFWVLEQEVG